MRLVLLLATTLAGCSRPVDDTDTQDTAEPEGVVGGVQLLEWRADSPEPWSDGSVWVWGLYDRPLLGQIFGVVAEWAWEVVLSEGECVYLDQILYTCDPACESDELCVADGVCQEWPQLAPAGDIEVTGLRQDLTLVPMGQGWYSTEQEIGDDLFDAGATIEAVAEGDQTPAFTVQATAPAPFTEPLSCDFDLPDGDYEVKWTPAGGQRVRWEMVSAFHAGDGPMVLCESPDDGSIVVPAALIDRYQQDRTQFEVWELTRYDQATAAVGEHLVGLEVGTRRVCW